MADPIRVLLLEDRRADAELMVAELRRAGFEPEWDLVDTEADFVAALVHAPEIVLADYAMPHWDGLKALRVLRERELDIPAIIVTGALGEENAAECIRMGAAAFLLTDPPGRLGPAVPQSVRPVRPARAGRPDPRARTRRPGGPWRPPAHPGTTRAGRSPARSSSRRSAAPAHGSSAAARA